MSVTGIGGILFKCRDPEGLRSWYREHLGLTSGEDGGVCFEWREEGEEQRAAGRRASTTWAPLPDSTNRFEPSHKPFMVNYRVADLDALIEGLRRGDVVDTEALESEDGRFAWVMDPEGGRVELWEPARIVSEHPPHTGSVMGLGGVFFKSDDPVTLKAWYADRLGVTPDPEGYVTFPCRDMDGRSTSTAWEAFPADTDYFDPSDRPFMINFRARDLEGLLMRLRASGVDVDSRIDEYEFGRFGWIMDPEGHRIELWEPPA